MRHPWIQLVATTALWAPLFVQRPASAESADRTRATALVRSLKAKPEHQPAVRGLLTRTESTLRRADEAHGAGDHQHATELEALARELAETANDLARALEAEHQLAELSRRALAAETRAVRARVFVEQTAARRGRAAAQLAALEAERGRISPPGTPAKPAAPAPAPAPSGPTEQVR